MPSEIILLDVATDKIRKTLKCPWRDVRSVAFSPDGKTLAAVSDLEKTIRIWAIESGEQSDNRGKPPEGWEGFSSEKHGFTVWFPGTPTENKEEVATPDGPVDSYWYSCRSKKGIFSVMVSGAFRNNLTDEERFDGAREGLLNGTNGKLISLTKIKLGEFPGREIFVKTGKGNHGRVRLFIVGKQMFQVLMVSGSEDYVNSEEANVFFSSFKLSKTKGAAKP